MPDEIIVKTKSESDPTSAPTVTENQTISLNRSHLTNLCAAGIGVSFFLPWASIFGANISGFDLQKLGDEQRLLWAIPVFSVVTIFAGIAKLNQQIVGQLTGALPFVVGVYWYMKLKDDFIHVLTYGAFLSLMFGAALFILPRKGK